MKAKTRHRFVAALIIVVGLAATGTAWLYVRTTAIESQCALCTRPLHKNVQVEAEIGGKRQMACCAACALAARSQVGQPVRLISVADFDSGDRLSPESAAYVIQSELTVCMLSTGRKLDENKREIPLHFDRCVPGVLAFKTRDRAIQFTRQHGGAALTFAELLEGKHD